MIVIAAACLTLGLAALIYITAHRKRGAFEAKVQTVKPPAPPREQPPFLTFRVGDGVIHIRADAIQSFAYFAPTRTLTINDGTEAPATIPDPKHRCYARLCQRFGCIPMENTLKGAGRK